MCISSVPRQNSTFPGVTFEMFVPPLTSIHEKKKKRHLEWKKGGKLMKKKSSRNGKGEERKYFLCS